MIYRLWSCRPPQTPVADLDSPNMVRIPLPALLTPMPHDWDGHLRKPPAWCSYKAITWPACIPYHEICELWNLCGLFFGSLLQRGIDEWVNQEIHHLCRREHEHYYRFCHPRIASRIVVIPPGKQKDGEPGPNRSEKPVSPHFSTPLSWDKEEAAYHIPHE